MTYTVLPFIYTNIIYIFIYVFIFIYVYIYYKPKSLNCWTNKTFWSKRGSNDFSSVSMLPFHQRRGWAAVTGAWLRRVHTWLRRAHTVEAGFSYDIGRWRNREWPQRREGLTCLVVKKIIEEIPIIIKW